MHIAGNYTIGLRRAHVAVHGRTDGRSRSRWENEKKNLSCRVGGDGYFIDVEVVEHDGDYCRCCYYCRDYFPVIHAGVRRESFLCGDPEKEKKIKNRRLFAGWH